LMERALMDTRSLCFIVRREVESDGFVGYSTPRLLKCDVLICYDAVPFD